jgi:prephenate dehydrogenase
MKVGIIGGTGGMGSLFSHVFQDAGHNVKVSGRRTEITNEDIARNSDLIIVTVPIRDTVPVIESIIPFLSEKQLITDLTSLKSGPVNAMLKSSARVIGLHPMFGPSVGTIEGQTIVATPVRYNIEDLSLLKSVFEGAGARVTETTPEYHDKMMAVIQGLTHFKAILLAGTMRRLSISPADTEPFISPIYRIETDIAGRILSQSPDLYCDILSLNPSVPSVVDTCIRAAGEIRDIISSGDVDAFSAEFLASRAWYGEFCDQAQKETDDLILSMVHQ